MKNILKMIRFKKTPGGKYVHVKVKSDVYVAAPVWAVVAITCTVVVGIVTIIGLFISPFWN